MLVNEVLVAVNSVEGSVLNRQRFGMASLHCTIIQRGEVVSGVICVVTKTHVSIVAYV